MMRIIHDVGSQVEIKADHTPSDAALSLLTARSATN